MMKQKNLNFQEIFSKIEAFFIPVHYICKEIKAEWMKQRYSNGWTGSYLCWKEPASNRHYS